MHRCTCRENDDEKLDRLVASNFFFYPRVLFRKEWCGPLWISGNIFIGIQYPFAYSMHHNGSPFRKSESRHLQAYRSRL